MVEQLQQEGSQHITLPVGKKSLFTFRHVRALRTVIETNKVDIVHVRSRFPAWVNHFALKGIPEARRPKLISTIHGAYSVNRYSKIMMNSDRIIAISQFIKHYILSNYPDVDDKKITVIHRGVGQSHFPRGYTADADWLENWYKEFPQTKDKIVICLPGRITRWKGQEDFLKIAHGLKSSELNFHAIVVGGFDQQKQHFFTELQDLAKQLSLSEHLTFVGSRPDIKDIMSISDLVYSLSKKPEPFGRTSLEALSLGRPVIAYDHGGGREVLSELFPQGLCEANNTEAAIHKTLKVLQNADPIKPNTQFTLENMLDKTLRLYLAAADHHSSS